MIYVTTRGDADFIPADTFTVQATTGTLHVYDGSRLAVVYASGAWVTARRVTGDEAEAIRAEDGRRQQGEARWFATITSSEPSISIDASTTESHRVQ